MKWIRYMFCIGLIFTSNAMAQQRIRDLSLSPEETAQQPNINNNSTTPLGANVPPPDFQNDVSRRIADMNRAGNISPMAPPPLDGDQPIGMPSKNFMDGYCDPNFVPMLANNRKYYGQESCLQQERDDSCARFKNLPKEVKMALDDAIGCMFSNGNGYVAEKNQSVANDSPACADNYIQRIDLLKKFMGDPYIAYALVYLPDNVLDTSGACVNRQ